MSAHSRFARLTRSKWRPHPPRQPDAHWAAIGTADQPYSRRRTTQTVIVAAIARERELGFGMKHIRGFDRHVADMHKTLCFNYLHVRPRLT
jgi:hypothetical protein